MKLLDVLYYHYYLFNTKLVRDSEPFATTNWMLSFNESLLVNGLIDFTLAKLFCIRMALWSLIAIFLLILAINYFYYNRSGRAREIVTEKPLLFGNSKISIWFTILFFLITISWLFWGHFYMNYLMSKCE